MTLRSLLFVTSLMLVATACTRRLEGKCTSDRDCEAGATCDADTRSCVESGGGACTTDTDCDVTSGEVCLQGTCAAGSTGPVGGSCGVTADCPIDQFCNSATSACQPLLADWCREANQCGSDKPICSSQSTATPGRCVECLTNADCGAGVCAQPGICQDDDGSSPVDPGPGPDPVDPDPVTCGQNQIPQGDRCVCSSGFVDDGTGDCVADTGEPDPTDPTDTGDVCAEYGWYGDGVCDDFCPQEDTADCDVGTEPGEPAEDDICAEYGWYDDGMCDEFCPSPDPDCGGTSAGALGENESCVSGGQVLQCQSGLDCIYVADSFGDPSYGSCKQTCSGNAECGVGRSCALGFLSNGDGICGRPKSVDETGCTFWEQGDTFCFDASAPSGANDAFLECMNTRCEFLCDYEGNTDGPLNCPGGSQCGAPQPMSGFDVDVAQCQ